MGPPTPILRFSADATLFYCWVDMQATTSPVAFCRSGTTAACLNPGSSNCHCGGDPAQTSESFLRFLTPLAVAIGVFLLHVIWQRVVRRLPAYQRAHRQWHEKEQIINAAIVMPMFVPVDEPVGLPQLLAALDACRIHEAVVSTDAIEVTLPRCFTAPSLPTSSSPP
ncbi:hypothetical protein SDRG_07999 [Saprolegnia diclina VS20]|uniref:Uncharacterized protein n=1 Tax=Saprolegnia diclina (strain VS20) TaxID=1156394 RepID=T0QIY3_SAPDV|nr:hypothetical protein SDRG_07999 [Saprolegnia diclina VS20]EQC34681.1 hypothetical protein SDRG_07999 [Saprolegnia diclina VS20]|eukprot:XP_008612087.1 hypothetical protein SDRG_07999 [Saprolegnia diclina VS20]